MPPSSTVYALPMSRLSAALSCVASARYSFALRLAKSGSLLNLLPHASHFTPPGPASMATLILERDRHAGQRKFKYVLDGGPG
jgi:hypothetical protein